MVASGNGHVVLPPGEGEVIEARGSRVVVKVANASQFVGEYTAPPRFPGPPLHVHPGMDETFLVLEGQLDVTVNGRTAELAAGAAAHISGSVPHTFSNPEGEPARFLLVCTPGGMEQFFRGMAADDAELVAAISERFGYRPVALEGQS